MSWVAQEMRTVDLGDKRLNHRLVSLLDKLSCNAPASIPVACDSWSETKAAYRLFDNPKVTAPKILLPHWQATLERIRHEEVVLLIQDSSTLNFPGQLYRGDIGPLTSEKHRGLMLRPTIAVTPDRRRLGACNYPHLP